MNRDAPWERSIRRRFTMRLTLRRADGSVYLDRWGVGTKRLGHVFLHRMRAPDPGQHLHDHPWTFITVPLWGSYLEERADIRWAPTYASLATVYKGCTHGSAEDVRWLRPRRMRLDEAHRIIKLHRRTVWTLVVTGPWRRLWGFYLPDGYVDEGTYDKTVRAKAQDMWSDQNAAARPW